MKGMHSNTRQLIVLQSILDIEYDGTLDRIDIEPKIIENYAQRKKES